MQEKRTWPVSDPVSVHAFEEANVVNVLSSVGEKFADVLSGLTILLKFPQRFHYSVLDYFSGLCQCARIIKTHHLTVILIEVLFVVVRVDVTNSSGHEDEDYAFRFGGVMKCGAAEWAL